MPDTPDITPNLETLSAEQFEIESLDDEIRVDALCVGMIRTFFNATAEQTDLDPASIGQVCHGIDYFLREFVIADRRDNLLRLDATHIRRFAGHWYIVRNLEPNMAELGLMLDGIAAFYRFLAGHGLVSDKLVNALSESCSDRDYYRQRIEDFWNIEGGGFLAWRDQVPL